MNDIYEDNKILRFVITYIYINIYTPSIFCWGPLAQQTLRSFRGLALKIPFVKFNLPKLSLPLLVRKFTLKHPWIFQDTNDIDHEIAAHDLYLKKVTELDRKRNSRPENLEIEKTLNSPQKTIFSSWWFSNKMSSSWNKSVTNKHQPNLLQNRKGQHRGLEATHLLDRIFLLSNCIKEPRIHGVNAGEYHTVPWCVLFP